MYKLNLEIRRAVRPAPSSIAVVVVLVRVFGRRGRGHLVGRVAVLLGKRRDEGRVLLLRRCSLRHVRYKYEKDQPAGEILKFVVNKYLELYFPAGGRVA